MLNDSWNKAYLILRHRTSQYTYAAQCLQAKNSLQDKRYYWVSENMEVPNWKGNNYTV